MSTPGASTRASMTGGVTVLGLGNVLKGDDALGPHVLRTLEACYELDPEITVIDAGTPGLALGTHIADADALVVVDTVASEGAPGELRLYRRDELLAGPLSSRLTTHEPGLEEALLTLELEGRAPGELLVVGVVPGRTETGIGLTPEVEAAVPRAIAEVVSELQRLGRPPRRRAPPAPPDLWWQEPPPP